jgi:hypothetical protein|tara:strand:- start:7008 stop:7346 length:339 start_codon:yes stop_codon:yes gene_type:complete
MDTPSNARLAERLAALEKKVAESKLMMRRPGSESYEKLVDIVSEHDEKLIFQERVNSGLKEIVLEALREWVQETEYLTQASDPEGRYYCSKSDCEGVRFGDQKIASKTAKGR